MTLDRRRRLRAAAACSPLLAAGCVPPPRPGSLEFRGWAYEPNEVRANLDVFEARHPRVPVEYAAVSGNYHDKMVAMFVAETPLDCCYVRDDHFAEWAEAGWIVP